ncbi:MAG: cysteine synthase family protein [Clostridiales bacterium]|nr:cysteine synthase family protein [Clostridiales bacterium]
MIANSALDLIGNTPLVRLSRLTADLGLSAEILGKLEKTNPGGSIKDRIALAILRDAEARGQLQPNGTVIEATSGNTGVGLAMAGALLGYRVILTMPENMSRERILLFAAYGAEVELTPKALGMQGAVDRALALAAEIPNSFLTRQFENPANPNAHAGATAREIVADLGRVPDVFVSAIGTGGTVSGVGRALRELEGDSGDGDSGDGSPVTAVTERTVPLSPSVPLSPPIPPREGVWIVGVEPAESPLLTKGTAGPHGIQGTGANFVPQNLDRDILSEVIAVSTEQAKMAMRELARVEGLFCGISSGAAVFAALTLARQTKWQDKTIVVILPDTGERYLSLSD